MLRLDVEGRVGKYCPTSHLSKRGKQIGDIRRVCVNKKPETEIHESKSFLDKGRGVSSGNVQDWLGRESRGLGTESLISRIPRAERDKTTPCLPPHFIHPQYLPQSFSINPIVCLLQIYEAHIHSAFFLSYFATYLL